MTLDETLDLLTANVRDLIQYEVPLEVADTATLPVITFTVGELTIVVVPTVEGETAGPFLDVEVTPYRDGQKVGTTRYVMVSPNTCSSG